MALDLERLRKLAGGEFRVGLDGAVSYVEWDLPPEEVMESAAARVRPLLLQGDDCFYGSVLASLGYFLRDHPARQNVREIRKMWQARVDESTMRGDAGYIVLVKDEATGAQGSLSDLQLALAWVYGDVVHHDADRRAGAQAFGVRERYRAAVPLVAFVMLNTVRLLGFVQSLYEAGLIPLDALVLTEDVIVSETTFRVAATVRIAELGTPAPSSVDEPWPSGWERLVDRHGPSEDLAPGQVPQDDSATTGAGPAPL